MSNKEVYFFVFWLSHQPLSFLVMKVEDLEKRLEERFQALNLLDIESGIRFFPRSFEAFAPSSLRIRDRNFPQVITD